MKNSKIIFSFVAAAALFMASCQKKDRPSLGEYPKDTNTPGGPLKFYAAFDGTSTDKIRNCVDSIRANFPSSNPLESIDGINGKALKGENKKYAVYKKPNDWAGAAKSFTISFWYKHDGQTQNNTGTNGPEYIFSFKSSNNHWSGSSMLVFMEGNNAACAVKVMIADKNVADNWFTWEGGNTIAGIMDNNWHHVALVYSSDNSTMRLFLDGVANPNTRTWGGHGDINLDNGAITEMRVGSGPSNSIDSDDWLASTFKGGIDQLRLYSEALTNAEVQALFSDKK